MNVMNVVFLGVAGLLAAAAGYWSLDRGTPRPAGTRTVGALLGSFAIAFTLNSPLGANAADTAVPHLDRLLSNCSSLTAAHLVLAVCVHLTVEPAQARRLVRINLALLAATVLGMTTLFTYRQTVHDSPQAYALYVLLYISYLSYAIIGFAQQTLRQSAAAPRSSVRLGLSLATGSCAFALMYTAYKLSVVASLGLGLNAIPDNTGCSSLATAPCFFGMTCPLLSMLLLCIGLTLPAVAYPISQARRCHWEERSLAALGPLWNDLTTAMPHIVLHHDRCPAAEPDFRLQRRVIEINDALLALRPYRSQNFLEAVERATKADTPERDAAIEAAAVKAALTELHAGRLAEEIAPRRRAAVSRKDLREDTEWLVRVSDAYACHGPVLA